MLAAVPPLTTLSGTHCGSFFDRTKITNSSLSGSTGGVGGVWRAGGRTRGRGRGVGGQAAWGVWGPGMHAMRRGRAGAHHVLLHLLRHARVTPSPHALLALGADLQHPHTQQRGRGSGRRRQQRRRRRRLRSHNAPHSCAPKARGASLPTSSRALLLPGCAVLAVKARTCVPAIADLHRCNDGRVGGHLQALMRSPPLAPGQFCTSTCCWSASSCCCCCTPS